MKKRIMIVEDEPITALALKTNLESFGYEVVAVESSGRDAIETCLKVKPDLILMDITLSDDIDGISAVNEITRHLDIPYIYLTAHTDEKTISRAKDTAPYGYLIKPIELKMLKHTIDFANTRHEMEKRVKESEAMFNYLANAAPVMIWMCDEKGQVTFLNARYRDYLGLDANDINCNNFFSFVHPQDIDYLNLHMKDAFTDPKESSLHYRIKGKDNVYRYFIHHAIPIYDTKGIFKGYIGSNMDVDEIIILQEKVKKLSFVVEHGPAVVVITDKDGNIEYVNSRFSELTGYSSDEVIGENPRILKSGLTSQKTYEELWKTILSGAVWRGELCNKKKSGDLYWELALISPLYDGHGNLTNFIAIKQDITDIKLNQIEIQRRTKVLEFFYTISNAFIKEETLQQSLKRCTDAMCRHLGAAISRLWLVDNEGNPTLASQSYENLDEKERDIDTLQIGSRKVKDIIKTKTYYITNDVLLDEGVESKEYAKRFKCNSYLGYPLVIDNEVIGVLSMFSKETLDNLTLDTVKASADTISVGIKRKQVENELKAKNKMLEDINEELRQVALREFRLRQEKERMLIQQSKMATMGEMLGMISHQWRQPLNAVAVLVQNLDVLDLKTEQDKALLNDTIQNVMKQIDFMSKTINDFRDFLRPQKDILNFNPCKYIEDVLSIIHAQLKVNNIRIDLQCEEKDFLIKGIPNEFMHVILNILNNAKDAIIERRAKGGLKITDEGIIGIDVFKDKGKTVIKIYDNGGGIKEETVSKIFDPYFTTKHHKEGTGLGLYMVKTIVEQHLNGTIQARNIDDGVEITITI